VVDENARSGIIKLTQLQLQLQTSTLSAKMGSFNLNKSDDGVFCPNMQLDIIISNFKTSFQSFNIFLE
jgi:hypothetical protein